MSTFSAILLIALAVVASAAQYPNEFNSWAVTHDKVYETKAAYDAALSAFSTIEDMIRNHPEDSDFKLAHNVYSDMTWEEFKTVMNIGVEMPKAVKRLGARRNMHTCVGKCAEDTPASVDWTTQGAVTGVKNQGSCGSCWTFSTTGAMEGAYFLAGNDLTSFSEEELVECATNGVNNGCNGGLMDDAFTWIKSNGGLCTEADYPYTSSTGMSGACTESTCTSVAGTTVSSFTDVKQQSESSLMDAVAQQPVSIAIQANQRAFQSYSSGVMTGRCGDQLDHGVLAVGYGTDTTISTGGTDFWKIKNSWGTTWGEDGYIRIGRGMASPNGECGILDSASYPTL